MIDGKRIAKRAGEHTLTNDVVYREGATSAMKDPHRSWENGEKEHAPLRPLLSSKRTVSSQAGDERRPSIETCLLVTECRCSTLDECVEGGLL